MRQAGEVVEKGEGVGARRGVPGPVQKEWTRTRPGMEGGVGEEMWIVGDEEGRQ